MNKFKVGDKVKVVSTPTDPDDLEFWVEEELVLGGEYTVIEVSGTGSVVVSGEHSSYWFAAKYFSPVLNNINLSSLHDGKEVKKGSVDKYKVGDKYFYVSPSTGRVMIHDTRAGNRRKFCKEEDLHKMIAALLHLSGDLEDEKAKQLHGV